MISFSFIAIFREIKETSTKYRNRIRGRISNLKDLKNPGLRANVLLGSITPERLAVMTAEVCFLISKNIFILLPLVLIGNG